MAGSEDGAFVQTGVPFTDKDLVFAISVGGGGMPSLQRAAELDSYDDEEDCKQCQNPAGRTKHTCVIGAKRRKAYRASVAGCRQCENSTLRERHTCDKEDDEESLEEDEWMWDDEEDCQQCQNPAARTKHTCRIGLKRKRTRRDPIAGCRQCENPRLRERHTCALGAAGQAGATFGIAPEPRAEAVPWVGACKQCVNPNLRVRHTCDRSADVVFGGSPKGGWTPEQDDELRGLVRAAARSAPLAPPEPRASCRPARTLL
jgi:hypothetical protein